MKKSIFNALFALCLLSSTVIAQDMYVKGNLGLGSASGDATFSGTTNNGTHEINGASGVSYGIALGYKINDKFRIEVEYITISSELEEVESLTYLYETNGMTLDSSFTIVNIYRDWDNWYLGLGIGNASTDITSGTIGTTNLTMSSGSGSGSAFGLSLGYKSDIDKKLFYDVGFKYLSQAGSSETYAPSTPTIKIAYEPSYFIGTIGIGYKF